MLKIYDQNKNPLGYINKYKDLCIESDLSNGDKSLSFTYLAKKPKGISNEYYIETKDDRYVVKEARISTEGFPKYVCQLDLEDLEADMFSTFAATNTSLEDAANLALVGTGWTVDTDITKLRSAATLKATPLTILYKLRDAWMCEIRFDTKNKVVHFREKFGEDKGVYFVHGLNLREASVTSGSYDYYTRIIPIGADGMMVADVNDGKDYVENYQYSDKIRTLVWEDTSYEDSQALKEDAEKKLENLSKPKKSYDANIVDLAKQKAGYSILSFALGDTVLLLDEPTGIKDKQRIVKLTEYPQDPEKNTCELSNTVLSFDEQQARLEAAAAALENLTNSDGTLKGVFVHGVEAGGIVGIETVIRESSTVRDMATQLTGVQGTVAIVDGELQAVKGRVGTLESTTLKATEADIKYATIAQLDVTNQTVHNIQGDYADFKTATAEEFAAQTAQINTVSGDLATYKTMVAQDFTAVNAQITQVSGELADYKTVVTEDFTAVTGQINKISGDLAEYKQVVAGDFTAVTGQIENLSGEFSSYKTSMAQELIVAKGWMLDGSIGNAQIQNVSANKISAGTLDTAVVTVKGSNGNLQIIDNTMSISDSNRIRVQVGKDASGDYTLAVWDASGKLIWDALGATENTIQRPIIRDAVVADDAAIKGTKLDIESVVTAVNGATTKISSTVVQVGDKTLNAAFSEQTQKMDEYGETLETHAASIRANESAISLRVLTSEFSSYKTAVASNITSAKNSAISTAANDATTKANNAKAEAIYTAASDAATKANNAKAEAIYTAASDAATKANNAKAEAISTAANDATTKAKDALADAKSYTNTKITTVNSHLSTIDTSITTMQGQIALKVEQVDITNAINAIEVGGRNLIKNSRLILLSGSDNGNKNCASVVDDYVLIQPVNNGNVYNTSIYCTEQLEQGDIYTLSFEILTPDNIGIYWYPSESYSKKNYISASEKWQKVVFTYTQTGQGNQEWKALFGFRDLIAGHEYKYRKLKLEKSNKASDWTPAPEDMESQITEVDNKFSEYSTTSQMTAAITAAKNEITTSVAQTYATRTELSTANGKITSLETWKAEASQKITKDGIVATVGNYYTTQSELTNAKNSAISTAANDATTKANNALADAKSYANTKVTAVETVATQTAEKFNWIVKSGTSTTDFTLTDRVASLLSEEFQIDALTTFKNSASSGSATVIDGGAIKANSIKAAKIDTTDLFSQNITATNLHITGSSTFDGVLNGATGSFDGDITATSIKIKESASMFIGDIEHTVLSFGNEWVNDETGQRGRALIIGEDTEVISLGYGYVEVYCPGNIDSSTASIGNIKTQRLDFVNTGTATSFVGGKTVSNAAISFSNPISNADAYHPIIAVKSASGNVWNLGGFKDKIGIYGYYAARTANGTDWTTTWDTSTGKLDHSGEVWITGPLTTGGAIASVDRICTGYDSKVANSVSCSNWFRSNGATGWYNSTYGGGIHMADATYVTISHNKSFKVNGWIVSTNANAFRAVYGNYGWIIRNDGEYLWFLVTNSGNQWGDFNSLRPFRINCSTGAAQINNVIFRETDSDVALRPSGSLKCGTASNRFSAFYAVNGTIQTSDEREKDILGVIGEDYKKLFMSLEPIKYRWRYGNDKKVRLGLGAQTTERKMRELGITDSDIIQRDTLDEPSNGMTDRYGMDYSAVSMMMIPVLQDTVLQLNEHDSKIFQLNARIDQLQYDIANLRTENEILKTKLNQLQASA